MPLHGQAINKHLRGKSLCGCTQRLGSEDKSCVHISWNKLIAVSSALAAAGVLTCAVALLDVFMPKESLAAFLASMALLGLVVTGVLIGYTWACDKCESYFNGRLDRLLEHGVKPETSRHVPLDKEQELWT